MIYGVLRTMEADVCMSLVQNVYQPSTPLASWGISSGFSRTVQQLVYQRRPKRLKPSITFNVNNWINTKFQNIYIYIHIQIQILNVTWTKYSIYIHNTLRPPTSSHKLQFMLYLPAYCKLLLGEFAKEHRDLSRWSAFEVSQVSLQEPPSHLPYAWPRRHSHISTEFENEMTRDVFVSCKYGLTQ